MINGITKLEEHEFYFNTVVEMDSYDTQETGKSFPFFKTSGTLEALLK